MNTDLTKLQDLFTKLPPHIQEAFFTLLSWAAAGTQFPQNENFFDLEADSGLTKIKNSELIEDNLDNFNSKIKEPVVISKFEKEDIEQFDNDLKTKPFTTTKKRDRNPLTDVMVIKNLRLTGNGPDDCKTAKINSDSPQIESLWSIYSKKYGQEKALEIGREICRVANINYEHGSKELKGSEATKYWKDTAQKAEEKFGIKLGWGIASKGQLILLAADELGYPVNKIGG